MEYTVDYFIKKFEAIPEHLFNVGSQYGNDGTHCSLGWCNSSYNIHATDGEYTAIGSLFKDGRTIAFKRSDNYYTVGESVSDHCLVAAINNGEVAEYQQPTPKQRILAALRDLKALQEKESKPEVKTVYVTVDEKVREIQKAQLCEN